MSIPEPTAEDLAASIEQFAESLDPMKHRERYVPAEWCRTWFRRAVAAEKWAAEAEVERDRLRAVVEGMETSRRNFFDSFDLERDRLRKLLERVLHFRTMPGAMGHVLFADIESELKSPGQSDD